MKKNADIVIIGGGIIGSATAYYLAKAGMRNIVVLEKSYFSSGSTGRCGAGVRQQWGLEMNALLAKRSVDIFETLSDELGTDIEFRQGGYLVLIENKSQLPQFEKNITLQNSLGIPSRKITVDEALEIVPQLNPTTFIAATFCPTDGHANPHLTNYAYKQAAERLGVEFHRYTEATDISVENHRVTGVTTNRGYISTPIVLNAAGGYSKEVAKMAGIDIPTYSERHQIMVTEPLGRIFDCMVISFTTGLYVQQVPHGSFVMGMGEKEEPSHNTRSSWQFLEHFGRVLTNTLPFMNDVMIVRQWAGSYNKTPDAQPIVGEYHSVKGFYNAVGFSGHGFMIAPMTALTLSQIITGRQPEIDISPLSEKRFERGELIIEPSVVG